MQHYHGKYPRIRVDTSIDNKGFEQNVLLRIEILDNITQRAEDAFREYLTMPMQPMRPSARPGTAAFILATRGLVRERIKLALQYSGVLFDDELDAWIHTSENKGPHESWDMSAYKQPKKRVNNMTMKQYRVELRRVIPRPDRPEFIMTELVREMTADVGPRGTIREALEGATEAMGFAINLATFNYNGRGRFARADILGSDGDLYATATHVKTCGGES